MKKRSKSDRKRLARYGLLLSNMLILAVVTIFIVQASHSNQTASTVKSSTSSQAAIAANPLDQVSSADIALTVARLSSLPESTAINNQAVSQAVSMAHAATVSEDVVSKPQVVSTALKSSADILIYTATGGDTVSSLAQKFGVTSDSIRWSNNITGDSLTAGAKLTIPPVNGFVYTVQAGDTVASLAQKFNANADKITAFNDTEIKGLVPGSQVMIPDGTKAVPTTAAQIAASPGAISTTAFPWGGSPVYGYNGYDYGYCTWYVATRVPVPSNWGNANTWATLAAASGWTVSSIPRPGAVAQTPAGAEGHVAYVEAVSDDGTMMKYSDMNGLAGFGHVGYSGWVPISKFPHYIYR